MFLARQPRHSVSGLRAPSSNRATVAHGLLVAALGFVGYTPAVLGSEAGRQKLTPEQIYKLVSPSLCFIVAYNPEDKENGVIGSGFIVSEDGDVLTNAHVVEGKVIVEFECGGRKGYQLGLRRYSDDRDLAQLTTNLGVSVPLKLSQRVSPSPGETVYALGSPEGLTGTISSGIVSSLRESDGTRHIQMTAAISPGSSGGPVVDSYGEVVGVSIGAIESGQSLNFAVAISELGEIPLNENPRQAQREALAKAEVIYVPKPVDGGSLSDKEHVPVLQPKEGALIGFGGTDFGRCPFVDKAVVEQAWNSSVRYRLGMTVAFALVRYERISVGLGNKKPATQWELDFESGKSGIWTEDLFGQQLLKRHYCIEKVFYGGSYVGVGDGERFLNFLSSKYGEGQQFKLPLEGINHFFDYAFMFDNWGNPRLEIIGREWRVGGESVIKFSQVSVSGSLMDNGAKEVFVVQYWNESLLNDSLSGRYAIDAAAADKKL